MTSPVVLAEATKTDVDSAPVSEVRRDPRNARGPGVTQAPPTRTFAPAAASSASAAASRRARASRPEARIESLDGPGGATDRDALRAKRDETPTDIVSGRSLPHPSNSNHVSLKTTGQAAKSRLRDAGITHLTPVQERVLRAIIVDRLDVLVQAPTGSGKTLAYLLPLAHALEANDSAGDEARFRGSGFPSALVILPTRELAAQVFEHAEKHVARAGFPCVLCCGGADEKPQISGIKNGARVVIGTPGRIKAFVDRGVVKTDGVVFQVLDECDRLLDGGFERDVEEVCRPPGGKTRTACFSATMPPGLVRFLAKRLPPDHATVTLRNARGGNGGGGVEHLAFVVPAENKLGAVVDAVDAYADGASSLSFDPRGDTRNTQNKVTGQTIVFVETKAHAERLAGTLAAAYEVRVVSLSWGAFFFFLGFGTGAARASRSMMTSRRPDHTVGATIYRLQFS